MPPRTIYSMQEMRLSDVIISLFSAPPPILVSLSILAFLIPARTSPSRACRKGFESFPAVSLSRFHVHVHPAHQGPHPIYLPFIPISHLPHYIPSQAPYTPPYTHFTYFMTQPLLSVSRFPTICCFASGLFVLTTFARLTLMFFMQMWLLWFTSSLFAMRDRPHCYPALVRLCSLS